MKKSTKVTAIKVCAVIALFIMLVIAGITEFARFNLIKNFYTKDERTDAIFAVAEQGATVIVEYPDGNVYEFYGEDFEIADNRITVFFED